MAVPEPPVTPKPARAAVIGGASLVIVAVTAMVVTVFNVVTKSDETEVLPSSGTVFTAAPGTSAAVASSTAPATGTDATAAGPPPTSLAPLQGETLKDFPSAATTGWRHTGVTLTPYRGPDEVTRAGTVIDGKDIGCIWIRAQNVVIVRS